MENKRFPSLAGLSGRELLARNIRSLLRSGIRVDFFFGYKLRAPVPISSKLHGVGLFSSDFIGGGFVETK